MERGPGENQKTRSLSLIPSFTSPMALGSLPTLNMYFFLGEMGKIIPTQAYLLRVVRKI